jgi:hypothetical protein
MLRYVVLAATALLPMSAMAANTPDAVPTHYWDVWVDHDGGTHQTSCEIKGFTPFSLGAKVQDIYIDMLPQKPTAVWIAQFPKGWIGAWHENPKPQWIIPLSGRWFVETTDGDRVEMGPGDASFGGDQGSKPDASGRVGHLSGTLGDDPVMLMFVQGAANVPVVQGCRFH